MFLSSYHSLQGHFIFAIVQSFVPNLNNSEASDKCQQEKRKTINGDDILWAMSTLGFDKYVEPLKVYLAKYREAAKNEKPASTKKVVPRRDLDPNIRVKSEMSTRPSPAMMTPHSTGMSSASSSASYPQRLPPPQSLTSASIPSPQLINSGLPTQPNLVLPGVNTIGSKSSETGRGSLFPESPFLSGEGTAEGLVLPSLSTLGKRSAEESDLPPKPPMK